MMLGALFAAGATELVIMLVIIVVSVLGQILSKWNEAKQQQAPRPPRPRPQPPPQPPPQPGPPAQAPARDPLADEIGEFLRRAAERRQEAESGRRPVRPATPVQATPVPATAVEPAPLPVLPSDPVGAGLEPTGGVGSPGQQHLGSFSASPGLGEEVALADDQMESHLHQVFDHQVGHWGGSSAAQSSAAPADSLAASVAAMFANPASLRQAILVHEILERPERRWESE